MAWEKNKSGKNPCMAGSHMGAMCKAETQPEAMCEEAKFRHWLSAERWHIADAVRHNNPFQQLKGSSNSCLGNVILIHKHLEEGILAVQLGKYLPFLCSRV